MSRYWWSPYHDYPMMMRRTLVFFHTFAMVLVTSYSSDFFLRCTLADDFPYAKNDAKNVSIFSSIFFLFVVGGDVLCVKEFKCLFTKHFARAWQGMFLKKNRAKIGFIFWAEEFSFNGNYSMLNSFKLRIAAFCREIFEYLCVMIPI